MGRYAARAWRRERRRFNAVVGAGGGLDRFEGNDVKGLRRSRNERADCPVVVVKIGARGVAHAFRRDFVYPFEIIVVEPPSFRPLRIRPSRCASPSVPSRANARCTAICARARSSSAGSGRFVRERFQRAFYFTPHVVRGCARPHVRHDLKEPGIARRPIPGRDVEREPRVDERTREPARAAAAEETGEDVERVRIVFAVGARQRAVSERCIREHRALTECGRRVKREGNDRRIAGPFHDDGAFAGLRWFLGVDVGNGVRCGRDCAEAAFERRARSLGIEIADDEYRRVVRLVEGVVEFAQPFGRHALDVGSPADGRVMVGMFAERRRDDRRTEHACGVIVVTFEFVANDGHLGAPVGVGDERAAHPVRFELDREVEVAGRDAFEVIRAIDPRRGVLRRTDFVHDVGKGAARSTVVRGRSLEEHVLEEVRRTRVADRLVAGADAVDDQKGGDGRGRGGYEDDLEAVVEEELVRRKRRGRLHPELVLAGTTEFRLRAFQATAAVAERPRKAAKALLAP